MLIIIPNKDWFDSIFERLSDYERIIKHYNDGLLFLNQRNNLSDRKQELVDIYKDELEKCNKKYKNLKDCIYNFQGLCDHSWEHIGTGPVWNYEKCRICRKTREV